MAPPPTSALLSPGLSPLPPLPTCHVVLFLGHRGEACMESWLGGWHGVSQEGLSWQGWLLCAHWWLMVSEAKSLPAQRRFLVTWADRQW